MSNPRYERRRIYDLDYFLHGGVERRGGGWSGDVAKVIGAAEDPRQIHHSDYPGHKRRGRMRQRSESNSEAFQSSETSVR